MLIFRGVVYIGDEILPIYTGIVTSHDPRIYVHKRHYNNQYFMVHVTYTGFDHSGGGFPQTLEKR